MSIFFADKGSPAPERAFTVLLIAFGVFALSAQVILIREFLVLAQGNELSVSASLACFLFWGALGSWAGGRIVSWRPRPRFFLGVLMASASVLLPASVVGCSLVRWVLDLTPAELLPFSHLVLSAALLSGPLFAAMGAVFPCAVAQASRTRPAMQGVSLPYLLESLGAGIGALGVSLFLLPSVNSVSAALILSGMLLVCLAAWTASRAGRLLALAAAVLCAAASMWGAPHAWAKQMQWKPMAFVESRVSRPGLLEAVSLAGQTSIYSNGVLTATQGHYELADNLAVLAMLQKPDAQSVLVLGGGAGGFPQRLSQNGFKRLDCVELNARLPPFARKHLGSGKFAFLENAGASLYVMDERRFAARVQAGYDLIFVNQPLPNALALNRYFTREFFLSLGHALNPGGVAVIPVDKSGQQPSNQELAVLGCVHKTLADVFPAVEAVPSRMCVFFASADPGFTLNRGEAEEGFNRMYVDALFGLYNFVSPGDFREQLIRASEMGRINTDHLPLGYFLNMLSEMHQYRNPLRGLFGGLMHVNAMWFFLIPAMAALLWLGGARAFRRPGAALHPLVLAMGLSGIAVQTILLFCFQTAFGEMFFQIGVLFSFFMIGLALGAWTMHRGRERSPRDRRRLLMALAGAASALPLVVRMAAMEWSAPAPVYDLLALSMGALTGASFPLMALYGSEGEAAPGQDPARNPARVYALDLAGSGLGAILTGPLLVAVMGVNAACRWLAFVNVLALLVFWLGGAPRSMGGEGRP